VGTGAVRCRYLLALDEPKIIANITKAAVVIPYISMLSAIESLLAAYLKIFMHSTIEIFEICTKKHNKFVIKSKILK
jgi:hypothetical protein